MADYATVDPDLVTDLSNQQFYDYIIVGSGLAGGILATQLINNKQRVLLIEKGGVSFTTHCLNTSRPHWQPAAFQGPTQDNDIVYFSVKQPVCTTGNSDPFVGGPVYALGGRSTVWGLYCPQVDSETLWKYFPQRIASEILNKKGYDRAFQLLSNGSQKDGIYPRGKVSDKSLDNNIDLLNKSIKDFYGDYNSTNIPVDVTLAQIAGEFNSPESYKFPQGAYSTVDALLDTIYSRNEYLTVLTNTEVLRYDVERNAQVPSVTVRERDRAPWKLYAKRGVILCAGTIGTAQIALNSGLAQSKPLVGVGLMDHQIWGVRFAKKLLASDDTQEAVKMQSMVQICGEKALLNVCVNAKSFLGRSHMPLQKLSNKSLLTEPASGNSSDSNSGDNWDIVTVTLEFKAELVEKNRVLPSPVNGGVVEVRREPVRQDEKSQKALQDLATAIRNRFLGTAAGTESAPRLSLAGFGVVAHEVGTMRLQGPSNEPGVVDDYYRVIGVPGLYACDLSIFPVSPPANPSLTLVAMALQLADDLVKKASK